MNDDVDRKVVGKQSDVPVCGHDEPDCGVRSGFESVLVVAVDI